MRKIVVDKHGVLSSGNDIVECPIMRNIDCDVSCHIQCAWFSIINSHALCQGKITIGGVVAEVTE